MKSLTLTIFALGISASSFAVTDAPISEPADSQHFCASRAPWKAWDYVRTGLVGMAIGASAYYASHYVDAVGFQSDTEAGRIHHLRSPKLPFALLTPTLAVFYTGIQLLVSPVKEQSCDSMQKQSQAYTDHLTHVALSAVAVGGSVMFMVSRTHRIMSPTYYLQIGAPVGAAAALFTMFLEFMRAPECKEGSRNA